MRIFWLALIAVLGQQRVDQTMIPRGIHTMDACFASFIAIILQDEKTNSPIVVTFSDMILNCRADGGTTDPRGRPRSAAWQGDA